MIIDVNIPLHEYKVVIEKGVLKKAAKECDLNRKVLIVTDDGIPLQYAETLAAQCKESVIKVLPHGEATKNSDSFLLLEKTMLENDFSRKDCVVALGGGVVGDLSAFSAACFMRGIDFYNFPTTVLSQVDSSVGGKTGIDFMGVKNIIGAFYQPKRVIIDPDVLSSLSERQIANGLTEALKMAATFDASLFEEFEKADSFTDLDLVHIISRSIEIKADVVEKDEKEAGLRKVLNFGHTLGHGIEVSVADMPLKKIDKDTKYDTDEPGLLHGECVGLGMLAMCDEKVKGRIENVLSKLSISSKANFDFDKALDAIMHDKKKSNDAITTVYVKEIGTYELTDMKKDELSDRLKTLLA